MRKIIALLTVIALSVSVCSCGKRKKTDISKDVSQSKKEIILPLGRYYENNEIGDDVPYLLIEDNNMLSLVNFNYETLLENYKKDIIQVDPSTIDDVAALARLKEPYKYSAISTISGAFSFIPLEFGPEVEFAAGSMFRYNEEDQIISFHAKDYYLEETK